MSWHPKWIRPPAVSHQPCQGRTGSLQMAHLPKSLSLNICFLRNPVASTIGLKRKHHARRLFAFAINAIAVAVAVDAEVAIGFGNSAPTGVDFNSRRKLVQIFTLGCCVPFSVSLLPGS